MPVPDTKAFYNELSGLLKKYGLTGIVGAFTFYDHGMIRCGGMRMFKWYHDPVAGDELINDIAKRLVTFLADQEIIGPPEDGDQLEVH